MDLHVIGATNGHQTEEHEHQHIAEALVREEGGIEEGEHHAQDTYQNHLQSSVPRQRQSDDTGQARGQRDGFLHRIERHPSLGTGPARTQSRLRIVGAVHEVVEVVDQVRVDLHGEREEQTQQPGRP